MIYTNINVIRLAEVLWSFSAAIEDLFSVCEEFWSSMIASCNDHRHQTYWWQQCPCNCKKMSPLLSFQGHVWGLGESLLELFPFRILDQLLRPKHRPWHVIKKPYYLSMHISKEKLLSMYFVILSQRMPAGSFAVSLQNWRQPILSVWPRFFHHISISGDTEIQKCCF